MKSCRFSYTLNATWAKAKQHMCAVKDYGCAVVSYQNRDTPIQFFRNNYNWGLLYLWNCRFIQKQVDIDIKGRNFCCWNWHNNYNDIFFWISKKVFWHQVVTVYHTCILNMSKTWNYSLDIFFVRCQITNSAFVLLLIA